MRVVALVPAAGRGERLGARMPKALVPVLGEPMLARAVRGLLASGCVDDVVVAAPPDAVAEVTEAIHGVDTHGGGPVNVLPGGSDRTSSVRLALAEAIRVAPDAMVALVHDAARAFTPLSVINDVVRAVESGAPAVVPVLPVADTVKSVDQDGNVVETVDRSQLRAAQTPQGFAIEALRGAYAKVGDAATDDAGLVERLGYPVHTVQGHPYALKITTAFDLAIAESVLAHAAPDGDFA